MGGLADPAVGVGTVLDERGHPVEVVVVDVRVWQRVVAVKILVVVAVKIIKGAPFAVSVQTLSPIPLRGPCHPAGNLLPRRSDRAILHMIAAVISAVRLLYPGGRALAGPQKAHPPP